MPENNSTRHYTVETYAVEGGPKLSMDAVFPILSKYTGTNVSLSEIAEAAAALQAECRKEGYTNASVAIASERITNGVVTMNVFQAALPQIIISGLRYLNSTNGLVLPAHSPPVEPVPHPVAHPAPELAATNAPPPGPPPFRPVKRATPEQIEAARKKLYEEIPKMEAKENDRRIHVVSTDATQRFDVEHYVILGNSVLSPHTIVEILTNIDGAFGTNVSFEGVKTVVEQLQEAYRDRGYQTVSVDVPRQTLTNATVKLQVYEGRIIGIKVIGNRYFSSNNVMASLPSLNTNMVLDVPIFNAELGRANLNQDRQIYPIIGPGPAPGTSDLTLKVKDRLPLHAKVELDNQSSPGTPDLRINTSAVYDNLWQDEHALGVQYGFSPEEYKQGTQWPFYDKPIVADYSAFYRLPLGGPQSIEQIVENNSSFGYDEATRQFNLPPSSGQPELTVYANRAAIDTAVQSGLPTTLASTTNFSLTQQALHQDITVNQTIGFQLSKSLPQMDDIRSVLSGGLDFKVYSVNSYETNVFTESLQNPTATPPTTNNEGDIIPLANTESRVEYLPLSLTYNANFMDAAGPASFGLNLSANLWYSGYSINTQSPGSTNAAITTFKGLASLTNTIHSTESSGHWIILRPSFSQQFQFYTNWITTVRVDGQWASEPLLSVEQFGAGGVNSVRGYHEGEVFGDTGWHVGLAQETAPFVVGNVYGGTPLTVAASVYIDYARVYLIDPLPGEQPSTSLCGTGFGIDASVGPHWQAQFLCSWPLLSAGTVQAYHPFFNFDLTAQF